MRTDASRFDAVEAHPDFKAAPSEPVLPADATIGVATMAGSLMRSAFGGLFLLIAVTIVISARPGLVISMLLLAGAGIYAFGGVSRLRSVFAMNNAPSQRLIAVIVKERTDVTGSSTSRTSYYTTLQTRDGQRTEYRVARSLVGRLAVDDIGVAYVRETIISLGFTTITARTLVEFIRFDV